MIGESVVEEIRQIRQYKKSALNVPTEKTRLRHNSLSKIENSLRALLPFPYRCPWLRHEKPLFFRVVYCRKSLSENPLSSELHETILSGPAAPAKRVSWVRIPAGS